MTNPSPEKPWYTRKYNEYYNSYIPWLEDTYLSWFGENKTSYTTKEKLKTNVTGVEPVQKLQDGVAEGVGGQFSKGGLLGGVGEGVSSQGVNRVERGEHRDAARGVEGRGKSWGESLSGELVGGGGKK